MRCLIRNGIIVDGTGKKGFAGSVLVEGDRIAAVIHDAVPDESSIESLSGIHGNTGENETVVIDAEGAFITPGFVDIHRHGDWKALTGGDDELLNRQGITTVVNGNCGLSVAPQAGEHEEETEHFLRSFVGKKPLFILERDTGRKQDLNGADPAASMKQYLSCLSRVKRSVHTGTLVGGGTVRASISGYTGGALNGEEEERIRTRLGESLDAGVLGVSLGIGYDPEFAYDEAGFVRVLEPIRGRRIPVAVHIRTEGDGAADAVSEVIRIASLLDVPLHLSHMKCIGRRNWRVTCARERELIREAIDNGLDVTMDAYPYITGSTQLVHLIPPGFQSGGTRKLLEDLKDGRKREQITKALKTPSNRFENIVELAGFENIAPIGLESGRFKPFEGCSIAGIAKNLQQDPYDTLYDILLEEECEPAMLDTYGCEEDLIDFLKEETCSLISDAIYPEGGHCHPRVYDAFPRFLIRYVREKAVFSIEEAIRKMTTLPASVYGLDRGVIAPGKTADLCVFHLDNLESHSDFIHPDRMCEGFDYVFTAGHPCIVKDEWSNTGSGEPLVTALTKTDNKS